MQLHARYYQYASSPAQVPAEAVPPPPVHWPSPLDVPDEIAAKSRAELPEACFCLLTMTTTLPQPQPYP